MDLRPTLRRIGDASPMVPAGLYTASALLVVLVERFWLTIPFLALLAFLVGVVAYVGLFVVVTWYRDDDWLAAGFLFALTLHLGGLVADTIVGVIAHRSIGLAVFQAGTASMGTLLRAAISVPIAGGLITLARKLSAAWTRRRAASRARATA